MEQAAATRLGKLGVMEPRSAARRGPDVGVGSLRAWGRSRLLFPLVAGPLRTRAMYAGLLRPDSIAAPACEVAQIAAEPAEMPDVSTARADAALGVDYASAWEWETSRNDAISALSILRFRPAAPCAVWV